jgi:hypothetical protein
MLEIMGIEKPEEMTGESLIRWKVKGEKWKVGI